MTHKKGNIVLEHKIYSLGVNMYNIFMLKDNIPFFMSHATYFPVASISDRLYTVRISMNGRLLSY